MYEKILQDIKTVKIQGAQNAAKAGIKAVQEVLRTSKSNESAYKKFQIAKKDLENLRPTEPCLRNTLSFLSYNLSELNALNQLNLNIEKAKKHFFNADKTIYTLGSKKIRNGMTIFTHCHSNTVMGILKKTLKEKKRFILKNTETRPLFQGRKTAKEMSELGVSVEHFVDSAARLAIKQSDIMLIGADAITSEGYVINKIGSEMFAEIAKKRDVPVYVCTNSWKFDVNTIYGFDEVIEKRHEKEVWKDKPKKVKISNQAFEIVSPDLITGIISEVGIYSPEGFIEELKNYYPWMFNQNQKRIHQLLDL